MYIRFTCHRAGLDVHIDTIGGKVSVVPPVHCSIDRSDYRDATENMCINKYTFLICAKSEPCVVLKYCKNLFLQMYHLFKLASKMCS